MKIVLLVGVFLLLSASAFADQWVNGYMRKDGTYVQPYMRTTPNSNPYDNYSTKGNTNPYTGQKGYENPYDTYKKPSYNYDDNNFYKRKKLYDSENE